jgi:redox-sensing transcriptional repressor
VIKDLSTMVAEIQATGVRIAMLSVPVEQAQVVTNLLVDAGVKSILNYAPINISVPAGVRVQYIDPVLHLQRMTYYLD